MAFVHDAMTYTAKGLLSLACRIDATQLERVPHTGPLIIVVNHISSLEVPIIYAHMHPRPIAALTKAETWENPLLGPLATLWGAIPLHRGEADTGAFHRMLEALENQQIVMIAPEGTRSGNGRLQRGRPGVVLLAMRSGAPLLPMAYYGGEKFRDNLRKLRRTDFHIAVGEPFMLSPGERHINSESRQELADALMYRIAALLPAAYRGVYAEAPGTLSTLTQPTALG
ncbi:MAG: 1-acyl-sn-glycerol-3-phosphate acyltransferase [Anaerolineae bacterium]|nr:1-acyl-sn-glycerol-3-phosphate acyltransferase [Anaerolineae bacterium]